MKPLGVLLVTFIVLKLTGQIDWTWWVALTPLWFAFFWSLVEFLDGLPKEHD